LADWVAKLRILGLTLALLGLGCLAAADAAKAQAGGSTAAKKAPPAAAKKAPPPAANKALPAPGSPESKAKVAGSFGSWTLLCGKEGAETKERCSLVLPLVEKDTQKLVFRVILTYGPQGRHVLRVASPTGVALQRGLEFSPDTRKIYRMPFQTCLPMGCKALLLVQDDMRNEMTASKQGSLTVYALNGKAIKTVAALDGFTKGMAALDKRLGKQVSKKSKKKE